MIFFELKIYMVQIAKYHIFFVINLISDFNKKMQGLKPGISSTAEPHFHDHPVVGESPRFSPWVDPALFVVKLLIFRMVMFVESNLI